MSEQPYRDDDGDEVRVIDQYLCAFDDGTGKIVDVHLGQIDSVGLAREILAAAGRGDALVMPESPYRGTAHRLVRADDTDATLTIDQLTRELAEARRERDVAEAAWVRARRDRDRYYTAWQSARQGRAKTRVDTEARVAAARREERERIAEAIFADEQKCQGAITAFPLDPWLAGRLVGLQRARDIANSHALPDTEALDSPRTTTDA